MKRELRMIPKFTFKKLAYTGRFKSFESEYHDIKMGGKVCGCISESRHADYNERFSIGFCVKDGEGFRWAFLKKKFAEVADAKQFVKDNATLIAERYDLHLMDQ
jgi:hypothetical protein